MSYPSGVSEREMPIKLGCRALSGEGEGPGKGTAGTGYLDSHTEA